MTSTIDCPDCGTPIATSAAGGCCAYCLVRMALTATSMPGTDAKAAVDLSTLAADLEVGDEIGRGGMGIVYKARQLELDRWVAVKVMAPESGSDPIIAERFVREA